jgi:hypothetical protein
MMKVWDDHWQAAIVTKPVLGNTKSNSYKRLILEFFE